MLYGAESANVFVPLVIRHHGQRPSRSLRPALPT